MKTRLRKAATPPSVIAQSIKIEKGVPIPHPGQKTGFHAALRMMQIGDSFFCPFVSTDAKERSKFQSNLSARCAQFTRMDRTYQFTTRSVDGGFRVWRIEPTATK